jgi:YHS domain-containing protein
MRSPFRQSLINEVNSLICPTCGCSFVRLGIAPVRSLSFRHEGIDYFFCCAGCRDLFIHETRRYLQKTDSLEVCPVCLAEKPKTHTVRVEYAGRVFHFCRCPQCLEEFHRRPAYYECPGCHAILRPRSGDCCVFCSYGSIPCPSAQTQEEPRAT